MERKTSFPFIAQNLFLTASFDDINKKSRVLLEYLNEETQQKTTLVTIKCIHAAIKIETSQLEKINPDILSLQNITDDKIIDSISSDELYFALKSWTQGIAEAGFDSLLVQKQDEPYYQLLSPLIQSLILFLGQVNTRYIKKYLNYLKEVCVFEGDPHIPSLISNLSLVANSIILDEEEDLGTVGINLKDWTVFKDEYGCLHIHPNFNEILDMLLEITPSMEIFQSKAKFRVIWEILSDRNIYTFPNYVIHDNRRIWILEYYDGKFLNLSKMKLENLNLIKKSDVLEDLDVLILSENLIKEIIPLTFLHQLRFLNLSRNMIENINSLKSLTSLKELFLNNNKITEIRGLSRLNKLRELDLDSNQIHDISDIASLKELESLNVGNNFIEILPTFMNENLIALDLRNNNISKISGIENLQKLKSLDLSNNPISSLSELSALKNLWRLRMDNTHCKELTFLKNLKNLTDLSLYNTEIVDLNPILNLQNLEELILPENTDEKLIKKIMKLPKLKRISTGSKCYKWEM